MTKKEKTTEESVEEILNDCSAFGDLLEKSMGKKRFNKALDEVANELDKIGKESEEKWQ